MSNSPEPKPTFHNLLWHGMIGTTLRVVFAGLLLHSGALQAVSLVDAPVGLSARLGILLVVACVFGVGATLTGALFLLVGEDF